MEARLMRFRVAVTDDAKRDIHEIGNYVAENDSIVLAERIAVKLLNLAESLTEMPERGSRPRELVALGHVEYRQLIYNPWRVIYTIEGRDVIVHLIADGRRDMRTLLAQRLLGA